MSDVFAVVAVVVAKAPFDDALEISNRRNCLVAGSSGASIAAFVSASSLGATHCSFLFLPILLGIILGYVCYVQKATLSWALASIP